LCAAPPSQKRSKFSSPASNLERKETIMADYSTNLDNAPVPQTTGRLAGFVSWHAMASSDGMHSPGTFSLDNRDEKRVLDLSAGFIADWPTSRTGWERYDECAKKFERLWNPSRNKIAARPGPDWKRVIELSIAVNAERLLWRQASYGAWEALVAILRAVGAVKGETQIPRLPYMTHMGSVAALGGASLIPTFSLLHFVEAPDCLVNVPSTPDERLPAVVAASGRGNGAQPGGGIVEDEIPFSPCVQ
jgi:hypothetical protein